MLCRCNSHDTQAMVRCLAQSVLPRHLRSAVQGDLRRFFSGCLLAGALKTLSHLRKLHVQVVGASEAGSVGLAFAFHIGSRLQTNFPRGSESLQIDFRNLGPLDLICCRFIVCVMCFCFNWSGPNLLCAGVCRGDFPARKRPRGGSRAPIAEQHTLLCSVCRAFKDHRKTPKMRPVRLKRREDRSGVRS